MAGEFGKSPQSAGQPDCVVANAVAVEPVSTKEIPNNREKYRENRKIKPEVTTTSSLNAASIWVFSDIPCEN
jgi:hypothetical protein